MTASARSVPKFSIVDAIAQCEDLFERYGGHSQAAGFTLRRGNLPLLVERITALAEEALSGEELKAELSIDAEVQLSDFNAEALTWLKDLEPWGAGNPAPTFLSRGVHVIESRYVGNQGQHLRLRVRQGNSEWTAMAFNRGEKWQREMWAEGQPHLDLVYNLSRDFWRGEERYTLRVADIRASG